MTSSLLPVPSTNAVQTGHPLSANPRVDGPLENGINTDPKPPNLPADSIPALPSSLLPLLLQYLLPPSPAGLPPHLLSQALSSRHRYLNIDPSEDLGAYYALSSASAPAVGILEDIGAYRRAEDGFDLIVRKIGYVAECEYGVDGTAEVKSFVQLWFEGREVLVVLIWEEGEWKYIDARPGPLLEELFSTPALAINSIPSGGKMRAAAKATKVVIQTQSASDPAEGDDSGGDYWARYDANSDSEDEESGVPRNDSTSFQRKGKGRKLNSSGTRSVNEDAYWAQYGTGSVAASPKIDHETTLMPVQRQYDSIMDGEEDEDRELRTSIKRALARSPIKPQPGAPKARMLSLDSTPPILHSSASFSDNLTQPDTGTSPIFTNSHREPYNHPAPSSHLKLTPSTLHGARDGVPNEALTLHRTPPLRSANGIAQGLALDLNTPPPTEPTLSVTSMLPSTGSPTSAVAPVFTAAGSGPTSRMSPLVVGTGSPPSAVERALVSGVASHATGGSVSVADASHESGEPVSLVDVLMRERRAAVAASHACRSSGESTKTRVEGVEGDEAVLQSVRGMFRVWRILRSTTRGSSATGETDVSTETGWDEESTRDLEEKREFLNLVVRALTGM